jgi:hypothetical protein
MLELGQTLKGLYPRLIDFAAPRGHELAMKAFLLTATGKPHV